MIYRKGNLLNHVSGGVIMHGCNAQGVMGSGFAKEFKAKYPEAFQAYKSEIADHSLEFGQTSWCILYPGLYLASSITQNTYGIDGSRYVSYDAIDLCIKEVIIFAQNKYCNINIPKIGAGLGGGSWDIISKIIEVNGQKLNFAHDKIIVWEL